MIEKKVENQVKDFWDKYAIAGLGHYYKTQGNKYSTSGEPDYTGSIMGKYVGIEAKVGSSHKLSLLQAFHGAKIALSGGVFVTAYADFSTFTKINQLPVYHIKLSKIFVSASAPIKLGDGSDYKALRDFTKYCLQEKKSCRLSVTIV